MARPRTIYLDYNATTPLDPAIRQVLVECLDHAWGNPSSIHHVGLAARARLDDAREQVAAVFRCKPSEIVFTSGGTEANNLAVFGAARLRRSRGRHLVCSAIEHHAVLAAFEALARTEGFELTLVPPDSHGRVEPDSVRAVLRPDTILVSLMAANNETGVIQPFAEVGALCRERGILYHCDAVQWFGKEPFESVQQFNADLVPLCAHKLHGPKGTGALYARSPLLLEPLIVGGSHEHERRAGTENLPGIVALAEVASRFVRNPVFPGDPLLAHRHRLETVLRAQPGIALLGTIHRRLCNTLAFTVDGADSIAVLANLDLHGICASSGSACAAGSVEPSHVLLAQGLSQSQAASLVRFSLGRGTSGGDIAAVADVLPSILARSRGECG